MSRSYLHEYTLPTTAERMGDDMDRLLGAVETVLPRCYWGFGWGNLSTCEVGYLIYANKTKANRLAARLDKYLGVTGRLERVVYE